MRALTTEFLRAAYSQETDQVPVFLLTITHPDMTETIRVSSDPTQRIAEFDSHIVYGTQSRGNDFLFFPFKLTLPGENENGPVPAKLELDNVRREYTAALRAMVGPASIDIEMVLAGTPDTVVLTFPEYQLSQAKYDANMITANLEIEQLANEPFPALGFTPSYFPGLFRAV